MEIVLIRLEICMYISRHIRISLALVFRSGQANYAQLGVHLDACFAMPFLSRLRFSPLLRILGLTFNS